MPRAMHLILVLVLTAAACAPAQQGARNAPPPSETSLLRMEGRIVGLTDELNRLSRRVAALEGDGPAEPPTPHPSRTTPAPPPGWLTPKSGPEFPESAGPATGATGWTAVVIDARQARTERGKRPSTANSGRWRALDYEGGTLFASTVIPERLLRTRPIFWALEAEADLGAAESALLGERPLQGTADFAEIFVYEDGAEEALFYVDAATATALRAVPNLNDLLAAGNVVVILSKEP